jgi:uncharacterized protein Yka (UPF0111/DUF47 family)
MFRIFPKDEQFFRLLESLAEQVIASSRHLHALLTSQSESDYAAALAGITAAKAGAKILSLDITKALCTSFVTPFDREDIQDIADNLYRIPKTVEKIAERVQLHGLGSKSDFIPQAALIEEESAVLRLLMQDLLGKGDRRKIPERVALLHDLENRGDEIRNRLIGNLFSGAHDVKDILIRRDIYDMMEKVVDRFRDVASVAMQTVLKHS